MTKNARKGIEQPHGDNSGAAVSVKNEVDKLRELHTLGAWLVPLKADRIPAITDYYRRRLSWADIKRVLDRDSTEEVAIAYLDKLGLVCVDADGISNLVKFNRFLVETSPLGYVVSTPPSESNCYGKYHIFYLNEKFRAARKGIEDHDGGWAGEVITGKGLLRISSERELDEILRVVQSITMMGETERLLTRHNLPNYADKAKFPSRQVGSGAGEWIGDYRDIYTVDELSETGKKRGHASGQQRRQANYPLTKPWWCQHYHQGWSYALIAEKYDQSRQRVRYHLSEGREYVWREANDKLVKEGECVHGCPKLVERENETWSARTREGETKRREYRKTLREERKADRETMQADRGAISSFVNTLSVLHLIDDSNVYVLPPIKEGRRLTEYGRLTRRWSLTQKGTGYKRNIEGIGGATAWRRENDDTAACTLFLRNPFLQEKFGATLYCSDLYDLYELLGRVRECHESSSFSRARVKPTPAPPHLAHIDVAAIHAYMDANPIKGWSGNCNCMYRCHGGCYEGDSRTGKARSRRPWP